VAVVLVALAVLVLLDQLTEVAVVGMLIFTITQ
jgi:hypothetical protein